MQQKCKNYPLFPLEKFCNTKFFPFFYFNYGRLRILSHIPTFRLF